MKEDTRALLMQMMAGGTDSTELMAALAEKKGMQDLLPLLANFGGAEEATPEAASAPEADLEELYARNAEFAAAIGACARCLGRDQGCTSCGGRGRPGSIDVDPALFRELIMPAVNRMRHQLRARRAETNDAGKRG